AEPDFGDLFGSENEASDIEGEHSLSPSPEPQNHHAVESDSESQPQEKISGKRPASYRHYSHDEENQEDLSQRSERSDEDDDDNGDDDTERAAKKQRIEINVEMPALPLPISTDGKFYLAKMPRFLDVDTAPFDPDTTRELYENVLQETENKEPILQQMERTVRWRPVVDERGEEAVATNTNFIEWEDGTLSLMVGKELYDVSQKEFQNGENAYLLAHQTSSGVLESHLELTHQMTFRPSETHRHMSGIATDHTRHAKTKMFFTEKDPEQISREAEIQQNERLRAQRKLDSQRRRTDAQYQSSTSSYLYNDYEDEED
ncbi:Leo1-like protein-domain-containing protein, partial [Dichotomocladium elegans]